MQSQGRRLYAVTHMCTMRHLCWIKIESFLWPFVSLSNALLNKKTSLLQSALYIPHTEPVEGRENGIWTAPPKVVELHFAPHWCLCGPVKYWDSCLKIQNMSAGYICRTAFCLVPGPSGIPRFFDCVYPLPPPRVAEIMNVYSVVYSILYVDCVVYDIMYVDALLLYMISCM